MPPFGRELLIRFTVFSLCILIYCNFNYFPLWFLGRDIGSDCISFWSLLIYYFQVNYINLKVKSMQTSGTEAIRTQLQSSKPKREITNITNSQNTKRTYGQLSEQLFPKRWQLSNRNRTKNNMNTRKVKRH